MANVGADDLNTLNIKLFPIYPAPPPVRAWQVPLFTVRYQTFVDENWDLTMQRVRGQSQPSNIADRPDRPLH
jgi:hypothetical protein